MNKERIGYADIILNGEEEEFKEIQHEFQTLLLLRSK